jgi:transcriptional regulator with XRE-family HTH domain
MQGNALILEARRRAGLTQTGLADRLGVPQSTIARWETGRIAPSFEKVVLAVRACDLDLSVRLVDRDDELCALVDAHLRLTPSERLAQNNHLVNFIEGARRRMAAAADA